MNRYFLFSSTFAVAASLLLAPALSCQTPVPKNPEPTRHNQLRVDSALRGMKSADRNTRIDAFFKLTHIYEDATVPIKLRARNLLRAHPERAERIKQALFAAAKDSRSIMAACEEEPAGYCSEDLGEYWINSLFALKLVRDPGTVDALLSGPGHGGLDADILADLLPYAADAVIGKLQAPIRLMDGVPFSERWAAIDVIEACLTRRALMRDYPEAVAKIRRALLKAADDADPNTRAGAVAALGAFRDDSEVRARLSGLALADTHIIDDVEPSSKNKKMYPVRAAAARVLTATDDSRMLTITRAPETGECRLQRMGEEPAGEPYIGPIKSDDGQRQLCSHYDPDSKDRYLCWKVYPPGACGQ